MTQTLEPMTQLEVEGKTRAALLELCQARGFKATGWKRERMAAALTGAEAPAEPKRANRLAEQTKARADARDEGDQVVKKAREAKAKRTGSCEAAACRARCERWEPTGFDVFHWELCACGHTQWAHVVPPVAS